MGDVGDDLSHLQRCIPIEGKMQICERREIWSILWNRGKSRSSLDIRGTIRTASDVLPPPRVHEYRLRPEPIEGATLSSNRDASESMRPHSWVTRLRPDVALEERYPTRGRHAVLCATPDTPQTRRDDQETGESSWWLRALDYFGVGGWCVVVFFGPRVRFFVPVFGL